MSKDFSPHRFGYEWGKYAEVIPEYESQFRKWVHPLTPADFAGRRVLDAGCGMGRNSYWALVWGAAEVTAFDADVRTVDAAKRNLARFPNAKVILRDIYDIDWEDRFDIAFSIGVIHHLANPLAAVRRLVAAVRPGGKVLVWVYGYEGNEILVRYVSPFREAFTSHLHPRLLHVLAYAVSIPFYLFIKVFPVRHPYLVQLKRFRFWHTHSILFDQLLPKIARYYRREEVEQLLRDAGLRDISLNHCNGVSWMGIGTKPN